MGLKSIDLNVIKDLWEDEIISSSIYNFLMRRGKGDEKIFGDLSRIEIGHAEAWNKIAKKYFGVEFKVGLLLKLKIFFFKILAIIMPLSFIINYLEMGEKSAILDYANILEKFRDLEEYEVVRRILYDEIEHELTFLEMLIGEKSKLARVKDAIYGMTDSLVEIVALVIGLVSVITNPLTIGLAGLIAAIGGTFSMTSGAYLSAKSQNDLYEGSVKEIEMKEIVSEDLLIRDLKLALMDKGLSEKVAGDVVESLRENRVAVKNLVKTLSIEEGETDPVDVAKVTGIYYILGALPAILPFFIGYFIGVDVVSIAIIALVLATIVSFFTGLFTAVLSGINIWKKSAENVLIIMGSTIATYTIGTAAKVLLGISV